MSSGIQIFTQHPVEGVSNTLSVREDILSMSEYFKNSIVDGVITLPEEASIRFFILKLVVEYCNYHLSHPEIENIPCEWDLQFSSSWDIPTCFRMMRASEFLNIDNLKELGVKRTKEIILETKIDDLKQLFKFPEGLSAEDRLP